MAAWPTVRVGELAEQIRGVTFAKSDAVSAPGDGLFPVMTATNITENGLNTDSVLHIPKTKASNKQVLKKNDVIITASSGSLSVVGRAVLVRDDLNATFGAFCKVLRPNDLVDPNYFAHFFRTPQYRSKVAQLAAGANINNLRNEDLDNLEIPLPPLPEQRRIASVLDEAQVARRLRRQAIELIARGIESLFFDMTPSDAIPVPLGSVLKLSSGRFLPTKAMAGSGTVAVYGGNGVSGRHDEAMYDSRQIVVGRVGAYCGVVHVTEEKSWVTDNAMVVSWREVDFELDYLAAALKNANLNQFASQSGQPLISAARLDGAVLRMPTRAVQREYVARLRRLHKIQTLHERHLAELDELFESLQHRAFTGQL